MIGFAFVIMAQVAAHSSALDLARNFAETFFANPKAAATLSTPDAVISAGDIMGSMSEYLNLKALEEKPFSSCAVGQLKEDSEAAAQLSNDPNLPWKTKGDIRYLNGEMTCSPRGSARKVAIRFVLVGDKIAAFGIGGSP